jgi:aspartate aminotransferase/aminotransferase
LDLAAKIPGAIHLEIGQPNFPTPAHIVEAAYRAAGGGFTGYTANAGLMSLRDAIAQKLRQENAIAAAAENVVVTVGGMGGLYTTFVALLNPGDEVLLPDPGWPNYEQMACLCQTQVVHYPLDTGGGFQPQMDALASLVTSRSKAIVINSPSNPTGTMIPSETMAALVEFASKNDLYLVSDECYEKIVFGDKHISPASFDTEGRVISVYSFSKSYAMTGWRVGFTHSTPQMATLFAKLQEGTVACASSISQKAAEAALTGPQDCIQTMVDAYRGRRDRAVDILQDYGLSSYVPQGAFYLLVDVSSCGLDSDRFAEDLLRDEEVAVAPGRTFGPAADAFVRVSLATANDVLEEGLGRLCGYIAKRSKA